MTTSEFGICPLGESPRANPTRGIDANGERNGFLRIVEVPVEFVETSVFCSVQRHFERVAGEIVRAPGQADRANQHNKNTFHDFLTFFARVQSPDRALL